MLAQRDASAAGSLVTQVLAQGAKPGSALVIDAFVDSFQATMLVAAGLTALLIACCAALPGRALVRQQSGQAGR